jgi:hypothetical protein
MMLSAMDALALAPLALAALAGVITALLAFTSLRQARSRPEAPSTSNELFNDVLADPRSCLQAALEVFDDAVVDGGSRGDAQRKAVQLVHLIASCPQLIYSEVIDDRVLLEIERSTSAQNVWIVSTDESIEFEYPGPAVAFSGTVWDNLHRGVLYKYLVVDSATTRERAKKLMELIEEGGQDDKLQVRFLPERYWTKLRETSDELVLFEASDTTEMFYRFPTTTPGASRKWVKAHDDDSQARLRDLRTTWSMAKSVVGAVTEGG